MCASLYDHTPIQNSYQPVVRIGNWFEEKYLEDSLIQEFNDARKSGKLWVGKARFLYDNLQKEVALESPKDVVHFGAAVQLMPVSMKLPEFGNEDLQPVLSVTINERVVRTSNQISEDCELTVAPSNRPRVRNSFRIVSSDKRDRTNEVLKYGQHFRMQCIEPADDPIYLYTAPKLCNLALPFTATYNSHKNGEINLPLGVIRGSNCEFGSNIPRAYTEWFCAYADPNWRFEMEGTELPSNRPLIITHAVTNKNLAVENIMAQTMFGPEFLVSVQNYCTPRKRDGWQNIWMLSNGHQKANSVQYAQRKTTEYAGQDKADDTKSTENSAEAPNDSSSKLIECTSKQILMHDQQ